jgi:carboxyl-terminal processing protease
MTYSFAPAGRRVLATVSLLALLLPGLCRTVWADPAGPSPADHNVTVAVTWLLPRDHLLRHPLDAEISRRCFKTYLRDLDPMKLYFYQTDIDAFSKSRDLLCEEAERGDISFAYTVFRTFLARVDERVKMVDALLAAPQDFTVDEEMVTDKDLTVYAKTPLEARDRWRKRIKFDLLLLKADKTDPKKDPFEGKTPQQRLTQRYHSFAKRMHQTSSDELLEMYLTSLTTSLDPHTDYMSPGTLENFEIMMRLKLEGIGASLQGVDGYTVVKRIIRGGAAEREGHLKLEDKVLAVAEGDSGEWIDVVDMKLNDVVKLIRGKPGTVVRLQVLPMHGTEKKTIRITRAQIELEDSAARGKVFDAGRKADGQPYKVGVIDLPSFYMDMEGEHRGDPEFKSTTRDMHRILDDFKAQGVDAVVVDLRLNGGGALTEAIKATGLFLYDGPVVQVKDADGRVKPCNDPDPSIVWAGPLVVLTSKFSASASEIFAGAIQDYGRGLIVGDHSTHGKGTVQSLSPIGERLLGPNAPQMGALKITMQQFYRPSGDSTQKQGVLADVELPSLTAHLDVGEADLDYPVAFDRVEPLSFQHFGYVTPALVAQLRQLSEQRCAASEKFRKVGRDIARYKEQKAKKYITLNEAKFLKQRAELDVDKEEEDALEKLNDPSTGIKRDYYLDEVLAITVDYLGGLKQVAKAN